jgi:hypothetical protein
VIGKRRGSKVHWRRRISPEMPAGAAEFGDGFRRFQRELARGKKGGRGRRPWAIYSRPWRGGGARASAGRGRSDGRG